MTFLYLYRGVSEDFFNASNGEISPKTPGEEFSSFAQFGEEHASFGSGICFGKSNTNEVVKHQYAQKGLPTSGVSSSPYAKRAEFYALSGGKSKTGYIYKLSIALLNKNNVSIYRVRDIVPNPSIPEDDEYILVSRDFRSIDKCAIVELIKVTREDA